MGRSLILRPWPFCESNECFALRLKQYCTDENVGGKAFREFWNVDSEFWLESLILMLDNIFYQSYFNSYPSTVLPSSIYCTSDTLLMNRKDIRISNKKLWCSTKAEQEQHSISRWVVRKVSLTLRGRLSGNRLNGGSMGRWMGARRVVTRWKPPNKCPHHRLLRQKGQGILGTESAQKMIQTRQNWEKWRKVPICFSFFSSPTTRLQVLSLSLVPIWLNPSAATL